MRIRLELSVGRDKLTLTDEPTLLALDPDAQGLDVPMEDRCSNRDAGPTLMSGRLAISRVWVLADSGFAIWTRLQRLLTTSRPAPT